MKTGIILIIIAMLSSLAMGQTEALLNELANRDKEIKALEAKVAELEIEVARLQGALGQASLAPVANSGPVDAEGILYLDKPRTAEWLEDMYQKYGNKIICNGRRYIDIGEEIARGGPLNDGVHYVIVTDLNIVDIDGPDSMFIERPEVPGEYRRLSNGTVKTLREHVPYVLIHLTGIDTTGYKKGGTYSGAIVKMTMQNNVKAPAGCRIDVAAGYIEHTPLTREQFRKALAGGFKLVAYSLEDGEVIKSFER